MTVRRVFVWAALLVWPLSAVADDSVQEVIACLSRNIPKKSSEQTVHFTSVDRIGGQREFRGKLLAIRDASGARRAKLCVNRPPEMRGSEILSVETDRGAPDTFVYTVELRKPTRVSGAAAGGSVFGTDFSYEDLQRIQLLNQPATHERLPDSTVEGRSVYVLVARPEKSAESAYAKVVTYVDKQSCAVIKAESFDSSDRVAKVLTAQAGDMLEESGIQTPAEIVMKDVRAETQTTLKVEELEIDGELDERSFEVSSLGRHCR